MNCSLWLSSLAMMHFAVPLVFPGTARRLPRINKWLQLLTELLCTGRWVLCCWMVDILKNWTVNLICGGSVYLHFPRTVLSTWTELTLYTVDGDMYISILSLYSELDSFTGFLFAFVYMWTQVCTGCAFVQRCMFACGSGSTTPVTTLCLTFII